MRSVKEKHCKRSSCLCSPRRKRSALRQILEDSACQSNACRCSERNVLETHVCVCSNSRGELFFTVEPQPANNKHENELQNKEESVRNKVQVSLQRGLEEEIAAEDR